MKVRNSIGFGEAEADDSFFTSEHLERLEAAARRTDSTGGTVHELIEVVDQSETR